MLRTRNIFEGRDTVSKMVNAWESRTVLETWTMSNAGRVQILHMPLTTCQSQLAKRAAVPLKATPNNAFRIHLARLREGDPAQML